MDSVRLVQFTDTHLLTDPRGTIRGAAVLPRLEACIAHARQHFFPADMIALTGDLVHDEPAAYGALERLLAPLDIPVLLVPGNHDQPDEMRRRLSRAPFRYGGTHRAGPWAIVLLESWFAQARDGEGRLGVTQLEALELTLERHRNDYVFIFLHHPPIRLDSAGLDALGLLDGEDLLRVTGRHRQVLGIAAGHVHQALDLFRGGGLRLMCTPATCMQFKPRSDRIVVDDRPPGYRLIELHADGGIATEVVWLENYRD